MIKSYVCFRHQAIPFKEQVGIPPNNTKQCIYVYVGALSIYLSFPLHFSSLEDLPAHLQLLGTTRGKRQHVKDDQFEYGKSTAEYGKSTVFKIKINPTKSFF